MGTMSWEILGRLLLAVAIGAAIGAERESRDKAAGLRTMTLICLGSALFTIFSIRITGNDGADGDPGRIAAQIVTGIGFLGAGAIVREGSRVIGLTTAATIWLVASLGIGAGVGDWQIVLSATGLALAVLVAFRLVEREIDVRRQSGEYTVACPTSAVQRLDELVRSSGLRTIEHTVGREGSTATLWWSTIGHRSRHATLLRTLFDDPDVSRLTT